MDRAHPRAIHVAHSISNTRTARPAFRIKWWVGTQYALLALVLLFFAFPLLWTVTLSLKSDADAAALPPKWVFVPTLVQYQNLVANWPFFTFYRNSLIVVGGALLISTSLAIPLAYSLARFRWRREGDISFFLVSQ